MCEEYRKDCKGITINVDCCKEHHRPHHECKCDVAYLNVYSLLAQPLASGAAALFEVEGINSGEFDTAQANITGEVEILKKGVYVLNWSVNALLQPPLPFPVPAWGFELYVNGAPVPGSGSGSCSITPDEIVTNSSGGIIMELQMGDKIQLVNISSLAIATVSNPLGLIAPIASARMNINLAKALM